VSERKSGYAAKLAIGNQMYGPGCCAHKVTDTQVAKVKALAKERGHFIGAPVKFNSSIANSIANSIVEVETCAL
jgi:hypothetical protein